MPATVADDERGSDMDRISNSQVARIAQWLFENRELGAVFTRQELADAAETTWDKADRRLRDLRRVGWRYHTMKTDATLRSGQYRLVTVGDHVWEVGVRRVPQSVARLKDLDLASLDTDELRTFARWIKQGERDAASKVDDAWDVYRHLSPAAQNKAKAILFDRLIGD